jgi:lipoprotein signal peptidase
MAQYIPDILLWLLVINHGIAFGAGLYEQRVILPQWFSRSSESGIRVNSAAMRSTDTGRRFWAFVTTVPLTLLTLANLVVAWQSRGPRHEWWLGAAVITLAERINEGRSHGVAVDSAQSRSCSCCSDWLAGGTQSTIAARMCLTRFAAVSRSS